MSMSELAVAQTVDEALRAAAEGDEERSWVLVSELHLHGGRPALEIASDGRYLLDVDLDQDGCVVAKQSRGRCVACGHETTKGSMGRHVTNCQQRATGPGNGVPQTLIHLRIQDAYSGSFWLDAEVRATATLSDIDKYLRAIWLECCGHLSTFSVAGWGSRELAKSRKVGEVLTQGTELVHIYDFGTESVTTVKAVSSRQAVPPHARPISLMARNVAPEVTCQECSEPASHLCQECQIEYDSSGSLCPQHAKLHPHDNYGEPIEIVNSPRLGLCGYDGPAEPPY